MHLIPIEDQTFDFTIVPIKVDVFCNGHGIATVERYISPQGDLLYRFFHDGRFHDGHDTFEQAVGALKRRHAETTMAAAAVKAIGEYVAQESAKLFGEEE